MVRQKERQDDHYRSQRNQVKRLKALSEKIKQYFSQENKLGFFALMTAVNYIIYVCLTCRQTFVTDPFSFGEGMIYSLFKSMNDTVFTVVNAVIAAPVFSIYFLLIKKVYKSQSKSDGADLFLLTVSIFPLIFTGHIFSLFSFSHLTVILLSCVNMYVLFSGKSRIITAILCAVSTFIFPPYIFTYFPAVLIYILYCGIAAESDKNVKKKKAVKDSSWIFLTVICCVIFILLLIFTPTLNRSIRHTSTPLYGAVNQNIFYNSTGENLLGSWNIADTGRCLSYTAAALPFFALFIYIWFKAYSKTKKSAPALSHLFAGCIISLLPAAAGMIFFRTIGLWMVGALFSQVMILFTMLLKHDGTVKEILESIYSKLAVKKAYIFLFILITAAAACLFYKMEIYTIIMRI